MREHNKLLFEKLSRRNSPLMHCGERLQVEYSAFGPSLSIAYIHQVNKYPHEGQKYSDVW